jgi:fluoroacetyl-CoA thioesterase
MPEVLATGFLVGLLEWACIEAVNPHLDWPREQSVGTRVDVSHLAATPPGLTITVDVRLDRIDGRRLTFTVSAHDGVDPITEGTHERHVIDAERFRAKVAGKARAAKS